MFLVVHGLGYESLTRTFEAYDEALKYYEECREEADQGDHIFIASVIKMEVIH